MFGKRKKDVFLKRRGQSSVKFSGRTLTPEEEGMLEIEVKLVALQLKQVYLHYTATTVIFIVNASGPGLCVYTVYGILNGLLLKIGKRTKILWK